MKVGHRALAVAAPHVLVPRLHKVEPEGDVGRGDRLAVGPGAVVERDGDLRVVIAELDGVGKIGIRDAIDRARGAVVPR